MNPGKQCKILEAVYPKLTTRYRQTANIAPRKMPAQTSSATNIMSAPAAKSSAPKTVAKKSAAPAAPAAVAAPVVVAAPVAEAPKKAAKAKAAAAPVAAAPVVVASTPVEAAAVAAPAGPTTTLDEDLKAVTLNLNTLKETVSAMLAQVKKLDKRVHREIKDARKRKRRSKVEEGPDAKPRALSIFERPTKVTEELLTFLGKPKDTLLSRSEVTKAVNNYVKENNLKNKHDIKPDAALKKLLLVGEGEPLTYFNLQRYLNRHYIKAPVATA
jgi:SWIB/MDM2 domain